MKVLKVILISLFILIVVLILGAVIFIKAFDINRFKPQIIAEASKALGRRVDFDTAKLDISLMRGVSLNVSNLSISDDPAFAKGDFLRVKNISLAVDALGYVFEKKIQVPNILIDSPRVTIIRQKDGSMNVQSIARPAKITPVAAPLAIPALFVSYLKGTGGTVNFIDNSFEPAINLEISDLSFSVNGISLTEAFPFIVEAAVLSPRQNIRIEGKVQISGQNYTIITSIQNLKIEDVISRIESPVKAEGLIAGKIRVKGKGLDPQTITSNLSGDADISITKAKLKDINVLRLVLDKISFLPGLAQKLEAGLPEKYRQKLSQQDTALSDIKLPVLIENGRLIIKDAVFGAEGFMFKGKGEASFDAAYSLEGSFLVPQDLSAAIVGEVPEMQYLLDDYKQIYIPLKISGKAGEPEFNVDAEYIAKRLLAQQAQKQISNLLDKILGTEEEGAPEGSAPQGEPDDKTRIKEAIGSVLGDIFR
jgi:hypothetical protein